MNKQSIIDAIHEEIGGTKAGAEKAVDIVIGTITNTLKKGDEVSIAGLGIFSAKTRAARTARNPRTGEAVEPNASGFSKLQKIRTLKRTG